MVFIFVMFGCLVSVPFAVNATNRPNIVFIFADDLGFNDVSFRGMNQIPTPNIDTIAAAGVILNHYYTQPSCTPSRTALMTGYYPIRAGLQHFPLYYANTYGLPLNFTILPQYLKSLGYTTRALGKWHLGFSHSNFTPIRRGFDSHYGYWGGDIDYFQGTSSDFGPANIYSNVPANKDNRTILFSGLDFHDDAVPVRLPGQIHVTKLLTERAVNLIRNHDQESPLFMYLAHLAVHAPPQNIPLRAPIKYTSRFPYISNILRKNFAGELSALDESVGDVIEALYNAKMLNNTIIIFSNDNGADQYLFNNGGSNWPLRGSKITTWEGGVRGVGMVWSPLLANMPRISNELMHISDWLPTLYHAAGGNPKDLGDLDGVDQWPMIANNQPTTRKEVLVNLDPIFKMEAIRVGDFKLVKGIFPSSLVNGWQGPTGRLFPPPNAYMPNNKVLRAFQSLSRTRNLPLTDYFPTVDCSGTIPNVDGTECVNTSCLYNLAEDPCEHNNIAEANTEKVQELQARLDVHRANQIPPFQPIRDYNSNPMNFCGVWNPWLDNDISVPGCTQDGHSS